MELYNKIADQGYTIVFLTNRSGKRTIYKVKAGNVMQTVKHMKILFAGLFFLITFGYY